MESNKKAKRTSSNICDGQKADTFATYLNEVFKAVPGYNDNEIMDFINALSQMSPPISVFAPVEVKTVIIKLNTRKAPGYYLLSRLILKQLTQ